MAIAPVNSWDLYLLSSTLVLQLVKLLWHIPFQWQFLVAEHPTIESLSSLALPAFGIPCLVQYFQLITIWLSSRGMSTIT